MAQLSKEELLLIANAADTAVKKGLVTEEKKVKRAVKLLRTIRAA